jgi:hypothetical protein
MRLNTQHWPRSRLLSHTFSFKNNGETIFQYVVREYFRIFQRRSGTNPFQQLAGTLQNVRFFSKFLLYLQCFHELFIPGLGLIFFGRFTELVGTLFPCYT